MSKWIRKNQILSYIIFTCIFSWLLWSYLLFNQDINSISQWLIITGGFGPLIGALITNYFIGGKKKIFKWFKKIINKNFNIKSICFAPLYPVIAAFIVYLIINSFSLHHLTKEVETQWYLYPLNLLTIMLLGGGQEEFGWRGFALPKLLENYNPLSASIFVGFMWFIWHIPLMFIQGAPQAKLPIIWYLINLLSISIILTFLQFMLKNRNIVPAIILHGGLNIAQNYFNIDAAGAYYLFTLINIGFSLFVILKYKNLWFKSEYKL